MCRPHFGGACTKCSQATVVDGRLGVGEGRWAYVGAPHDSDPLHRDSQRSPGVCPHAGAPHALAFPRGGCVDEKCVVLNIHHAHVAQAKRWQRRRTRLNAVCGRGSLHMCMCVCASVRARRRCLDWQLCLTGMDPLVCCRSLAAGHHLRVALLSPRNVFSRGRGLATCVPALLNAAAWRDVTCTPARPAPRAAGSGLGHYFCGKRALEGVRCSPFLPPGPPSPAAHHHPHHHPHQHAAFTC